MNGGSKSLLSDDKALDLGDAAFMSQSHSCSLENSREQSLKAVYTFLGKVFKIPIFCVK